MHKISAAVEALIYILCPLLIREKIGRGVLILGNGIKSREVFDDWISARVGFHIAGNRVVLFPVASGKSASDGKGGKK